MKKLLYSSIVLTIFSLSSILFQISCQEESIAGNNQTQAQTKFLYSKASAGVWEYWTANIDGSNHQIVPIVLPNSEKIGGYGKITSDGQSIIFNARNSTNTKAFIYSISVNGTNLKKLHEISGDIEQLEILSIF
jgi:hypothetical protein